MNRVWNTFFTIPLFIGTVLLLSTLMAILYSVPLVYLWNFAITAMFGLPEVTIIQMTAFLVFILILRYWLHVTDTTDDSSNFSNPVTRVDWSSFIDKMNNPKQKRYEA